LIEGRIARVRVKRSHSRQENLDESDVKPIETGGAANDREVTASALTPHRLRAT
jgi:hypothetical protein